MGTIKSEVPNIYGGIFCSLSEFLFYFSTSVASQGYQLVKVPNSALLNELGILLILIFPKKNTTHKGILVLIVMWGVCVCNQTAANSIDQIKYYFITW
jgi:hypothetical protein